MEPAKVPKSVDFAGIRLKFVVKMFFNRLKALQQSSAAHAEGMVSIEEAEDIVDQAQQCFEDVQGVFFYFFHRFISICNDLDVLLMSKLF